jgi:hypothetical protein
VYAMPGTSTGAPNRNACLGDHRHCTQGAEPTSAVPSGRTPSLYDTASCGPEVSALTSSFGG